MSLIGYLSEPFHGLNRILRATSSELIEVGEEELGIGVAHLGKRRYQPDCGNIVACKVRAERFGNFSLHCRSLWVLERGAPDSNRSSYE